MTDIQIRNEQQIVADLLEMAQLDIVGLWEIIKELRNHGTPDDDLQQHALKLIVMLLSRGFVAGSAPYPGAGRYEPWPDQQASRVIDRIKREWNALGHAPSGSATDFVWFELPTPPHA